MRDKEDERRERDETEKRREEKGGRRRRGPCQLSKHAARASGLEVNSKTFQTRHKTAASSKDHARGIPEIRYHSPLRLFKEHCPILKRNETEKRQQGGLVALDQRINIPISRPFLLMAICRQTPLIQSKLPLIHCAHTTMRGCLCVCVEACMQ